MTIPQIAIAYAIIGFIVSIWVARFGCLKDEDNMAASVTVMGLFWIFFVPIFTIFLVMVPLIFIELFYTWINRLGR